MRITSALVDPALLDLPWSTPLEEWPAEHLVALPQGISRHIVRFVRLGDYVYAVKETGERVAEREYDLLRALERIDFPSVEAVAIVADRQTDDGEPLDPVLITRHLQFSLPYRALFSHTLRPETMNRLLDALAALLVRMHLTGFFWGDCSLSNTLFRRDAGAFAAYLVDAETGALHRSLSNGQRGEDLEIARVNIFGEALDLAGRRAAARVDRPGGGLRGGRAALRAALARDHLRAAGRAGAPGTTSRAGSAASTSWASTSPRWPCRPSTTGATWSGPKVVDAGYHTRRLLRLTGLDAEENQARKLLNDLDAYRAESDLTDEQQAAHRWLTEVFEPVVRAVPAHLRRKLEPQELFAQIIEHKWLLSEQAGRDVGMRPAVQSFLADVLVHRPDEQAVLGVEVPASRLRADPSQRAEFAGTAKSPRYLRPARRPSRRPAFSPPRSRRASPGPRSARRRGPPGRRGDRPGAHPPGRPGRSPGPGWWPPSGGVRRWRCRRPRRGAARRPW